MPDSGPVVMAGAVVLGFLKAVVVVRARLTTRGQLRSRRLFRCRLPVMSGHDPVKGALALIKEIPCRLGCCHTLPNADRDWMNAVSAAAAAAPRSSISVRRQRPAAAFLGPPRSKRRWCVSSAWCEPPRDAHNWAAMAVSTSSRAARRAGQLARFSKQRGRSAKSGAFLR